MSLSPGHYVRSAFANSICIFDEQTDISDFDLAILGIGAGADMVRAQLYELSFPFDGLKVVDLGNARKADPEFTLPIIRELLSSKLLPIIIGDVDNQGMTAYRAFTSQRLLVSLVVIKERLTDKNVENTDNYLQQILLQEQNQSQLFHFCGIGCQTHFLDRSEMELLRKAHFECIRLGKAKQDLTDLEPSIRDADVLNFHMGAMQFAEAPALLKPSPSGFTLDQSCQIARYAGMSNKLRIFSLLGYHPDLDTRAQTASSAAQLIWYFIDGYFSRKDDFPDSQEGLVEYLVEMKALNYEMAFWKSQKSGRWWMQIPIKTKKQYERHCLIPCSYADYQMACNNELPDRLLNAIRRFG